VATTEPAQARILLVEDNEMLVAMFQRALEREGYDVTALPTFPNSKERCLRPTTLGARRLDHLLLRTTQRRRPRKRTSPLIVAEAREPLSTSQTEATRNVPASADGRDAPCRRIVAESTR
jgi:CheY-like chemotaxis protein